MIGFDKQFRCKSSEKKYIFNINIMSIICHKIKLMIKKYPRENKLDYLFRKSLIYPHNSWFLVSFCLVWCLPHISHNGSGSSHVLQKIVAITRLFSVEQGPHSISFTILFSLKIKIYIYLHLFAFCWLSMLL